MLQPSSTSVNSHVINLIKGKETKSEPIRMERSQEKDVTKYC